MIKNNIDSNKVFKYIQTQVAPNKINNTNMELTLAIMASTRRKL